MAEVTVLMPAYNGMPYLKESIESIQNQTLKDWHFIIVNDGSTDDTATFLDSVRDPRIQVVHRQNSGPARASNYGLTLCTTPFLARMDADDIAHPERLQAQLDFLKERPEIGMVGSQIQPFGTRRRGRRSQLALHHDQIYADLLAGRHAVCNPSTMYRTALLREAGGYMEEGVLEDWAMFLNLGRITKLANIDRVLLSYRIHNSHFNGRRFAESHLCIAYARDRAQRLEANQEPLTLQEFSALFSRGPLWRRFIYDLQIAGMSRYRTAQGEILGGQAVRGYLRLAVGACMAPQLTLHRLTRGLRNRLS